MNTQLLNREFNGQVIAQRTDGYFNATAMCKATGRRWNDYYSTDHTQEYLAELAATLGAAISSGPRLPKPDNHAGSNEVVLIEKTYTQIGGNDATFVHPQVAIHLAQWCSPKFAVVFNSWVLEYLTTGHVGDAPSSHDFVALNLRLDVIEEMVRGKAVRSPNKKPKGCPAPVPPQLPEDYRQRIADLVQSGEVKAVNIDEILISLFGKGVRNIRKSEQMLVGEVLRELSAARRRVNANGVRTYYYFITN